MKVEDIRLLQDPDKSFIVYHETKSFTRFHHHPEYELVYIKKGKGKRMIGDNIGRFEENDLVFVGSYLPHEWLCDKDYFLPGDKFLGEGVVIQFKRGFLGPQFFEIPENTVLRNLLEQSTMGIKFLGRTRNAIINLMKDCPQMGRTERLYTLLSIFRIMAHGNEYEYLASPGFIEPFYAKGNQPMQKALEYILRNFQNQIAVGQMLSVTNMSNTTFCLSFKKSFRMTFKEYLNNIRIGYACHLLANDLLNISQVAYESGFENISNFNRQFKAIKGITPREYKKYRYGEREL